MMNFDAVADSIFLSFKTYCEREVERRVQKTQDELLARIAAIPAGPQGERGADGKDGAPGPQGEKGDKGDPGEKGERGDTGLQGKDGRDGVDGKDGAPGPQGEKGADGLNGKDGQDGIHGKDGAPGPQGEKGVDGVPGIKGLDGVDGRDGRDGKDGPPGRDAMQIDVLEAIDETRSYPRGTFVRYAGGLIRAFRTTDPVTEGIEKAGWQVVVDGINEVIIDDVDERSIRLCVSRTNGKQSEHVMRLPVMIYRGVWAEGQYQRGDTVTSNGSTWHCERSTQERPGESPDWKQLVRKGRDGKDGRMLEPVGTKVVKLA